MCLATLAIASTSLPLAAQSDESAARQWFETAQTAYARGDYRVAAEAFETAYRKAPHGGALFAAGVAWEKAREPARAADAFHAALESNELPADKSEIARARLAELSRELARVELSSSIPATVSVAHVAAASTPRTLHLSPGKHTLSASFADGRTSRHSIEARAGQRIPVELSPPAERPLRAPARERSIPKETSSSPPALTWVAFGGSAVLAATGAFLTDRGLARRNAFDESNRESKADRDAAIELRTWATVSFVGAAALAVTGVVLLFDAGGAPPTRASAQGVSIPF